MKTKLSDQTQIALQIIWETLNGLICDVESGEINREDLAFHMGECRKLLENLGVGVEE